MLRLAVDVPARAQPDVLHDTSAGEGHLGRDEFRRATVVHPRSWVMDLEG